MNNSQNVAKLRLATNTERWSNSERFIQIISDPWYKLLIKLQHVVSVATYSFWSQRNALTIHLPITTNAVSSPMGLGSDSLPVEINLFNQRTYLADSMQFMLEYGCRFHDDACFYLMPSFRGEHADSTHLCQFYHSEVELRCDLDQAIASANEYFRYVAQAVLNKCADDLNKYANGYVHIEKALNLAEYPCITFDEAARILKCDPMLISDGGGWRTPTRAGEKELLKHFQSPLWLSHWDHLAVPFYQAFADKEKKSALNADFLLGFGEVIGLGERHGTADEALAALRLHNVDAAPYKWYIDMKKEYPMRTSGFGMGVERFLLWVLDHHDIRDLQLLPRFNGVAIVP
jgi:asparaginyl-tRNA synthetase